MPRRQNITVLLIILVSSFLGISFIWQFHGSREATRHSDYDTAHVSDHSASSKAPLVDQNLLLGESTAPKLENATLKAELGRSSWHLLHTMMAKFPEKPTADDSSALKSYIHLFARLYPCGDCARHFQGLLEKYPPQVGSRISAATWACHVHNEVNKRLEKEIFDCNNIGDFYDCGCGSEGEEVKEKGKVAVKESGYKEMELEKEEGLTRGG